MDDRTAKRQFRCPYQRTGGTIDRDWQLGGGEYARWPAGGNRSADLSNSPANLPDADAGLSAKCGGASAIPQYSGLAGTEETHPAGPGARHAESYLLPLLLRGGRG